MPYRVPSSLDTGRAEIFSFCMVRQARLMVAAADRVGGVSKSRSRTWVRTLVSSLGGWKPKRSSTVWVSSLIWPRRAASYCRWPRAFFSAA